MTVTPVITVTPHDFIEGTSSMNWEEAEDWCLNNYGSHLASIHNDSQNAAASSVCGDRCWIGATIKESTWSDWTWSDGTNWNYTMWNAGEPNDADGAEDCVHIYGNGVWNDVSCDATFRPLCTNEGTLHSLHYLHRNSGVI